MATTRQLIEHQEVGAGGAASITFSDIPQDYTHLVLVVSAREATGTDFELYVTPNSASSNLSSRWFTGSGSSVSTNSSASAIRGLMTGSSATSSTFGNAAVTITNYASSAAKSFSIDSVTENNGTAAYQRLTAGLWNDTTAISSLTITPTAGNIAQYSSASLYGIRRAALPAPTNLSSDSLLEEVVLTSSAASVTFSGLAAYAALGYTNLQIRAVARSTRADTFDTMYYRINGNNTTSAYRWHYLSGNGSTVSSGTGTDNAGRWSLSIPAANATANSYGAWIGEILDFSSTSKYKTIRTLSGSASTNNDISLISSAWYNATDAITSLLVGADYAPMAAGTRISLYGSK